MDEILRALGALPTIGAGAMVALSIGLLLRVYRDEKREKIYWRERYLAVFDKADELSRVGLELVKANKAESNDERSSRLARVVDIMTAGDPS